MQPRLKFDLDIRGRTVRLGERTLVMGVLNVTPDSFSDGGLYLDPKRAIARGLELAREGADWIDVGGESTRPGSRPIAVDEEANRVLPVIRGLHKREPDLVISIDTTKSEVAHAAIALGASVVNDVGGLRFDPRLALIAICTGVPLVLMHLRGRPETMQQRPFAKSVWRSVETGLAASVQHALQAGVRRSQLIIDPGFGFGKSRRQNFELIAGLDRLRRFRLPILVGTSRKSFVQAMVSGEGLDKSGASKGTYWKMLASGRRGLGPVLESQGPPLPLLVGDAAAVAATILAGAHIVRVHDVAAILPAVRVADAILAAGG